LGVNKWWAYREAHNITGQVGAEDKNRVLDKIMRHADYTSNCPLSRAVLSWLLFDTSQYVLDGNAAVHKLAARDVEGSIRAVPSDPVRSNFGDVFKWIYRRRHVNLRYDSGVLKLLP